MLVVFQNSMQMSNYVIVAPCAVHLYMVSSHIDWLSFFYQDACLLLNLDKLQS